MRISRLDVRGLRRLQAVTLAPACGLNLIVGDNGAGKTSLLEAVHLLAYGRSFRGRVRDGLVRSGEAALEVYAEWEETATQRQRRAGWLLSVQGDAAIDLVDRDLERGHRDRHRLAGAKLALVPRRALALDARDSL